MRRKTEHERQIEREKFLAKMQRVPHIIVLSKDFEVFRQLQDLLLLEIPEIVIKNTENVIEAKRLILKYDIKIIFIDERYDFNLDPLLQITKYGISFTIIGVKKDLPFWKNDIKGWGADYRIPNPVKKPHVFLIMSQHFH